MSIFNEPIPEEVLANWRDEAQRDRDLRNEIRVRLTDRVATDPRLRKVAVLDGAIAAVESMLEARALNCQEKDALRRALYCTRVYREEVLTWWVDQEFMLRRKEIEDEIMGVEI